MKSILKILGVTTCLSNNNFLEPTITQKQKNQSTKRDTSTHLNLNYLHKASIKM